MVNRSVMTSVIFILLIGTIQSDQILKKQLDSLRDELETRISDLYESFEQRYMDIMDANEAIAHKDKDIKNRIHAIEDVVLELESNDSDERKKEPGFKAEPVPAELKHFKSELESVKQEMEEKINAVHESLEERYIDFIDTNAVMVKTDSDLGQRINAVEEVVLDMEDVQNKNNQSLVTPEMLGNLNRAFQESIDFLTVKMTIVKEEFDQEILTVREEINSTRPAQESLKPADRPPVDPVDNKAFEHVKVEIESLKTGMEDLREWVTTKSDEQIEVQNKANDLINNELKLQFSNLTAIGEKMDGQKGSIATINEQLTEFERSTDELEDLKNTQDKLSQSTAINKNQIERNTGRGENNEQEIINLKTMITDLNDKVGNVPKIITTRLASLEATATSDAETEAAQYEKIANLESKIKHIINTSKDQKGGEENKQQQCTYTCKPSTDISANGVRSEVCLVEKCVSNSQPTGSCEDRLGNICLHDYDCGECATCTEKLCTKKKYDLLIIGGKPIGRNGGYNPNKDIVRLNLETLDPTSLSSRAHPMTGMGEFQRHCAVNLHGSIYIIGGYRPKFAKGIYELAPAESGISTGIVTLTHHFPKDMFMHSCTVYKESILACGTFSRGMLSKKCWSFNKDKGVEEKADMKANHFSGAMVTVVENGVELGALIAAGSQPRTGQVEFNTGVDWTVVAALPITLSSLTMNYYEEGKKVFVFGGFNGKGSSKIVYTLSVENGQLADKWVNAGLMKTPRDSHESVSIPEGFLLMGGYKTGDRYEVWKSSLESKTLSLPAINRHSFAAVLIDANALF